MHLPPEARVPQVSNTKLSNRDMRRKDREVVDFEEVLEILNRCVTVRVGMVSEGMPYVVPMSFGWEVVCGQVCVYIHSALSGKKAEALEQNPHVCVEGDIFYCNEMTRHGITARYESVIGFGSAQRVEGEEKLHALRCMLAHYGYTDYAPTECHYLSHTAVYKITLATLTGKRNLPEGEPPRAQ